MYQQAKELNAPYSFKVSPLLFAITGFGSFLFHATLKFEPQMLDELAMIYSTLAFRFMQGGNGVYLTSFGLFYSMLHIYFKPMALFHAIFCILILNVVYGMLKNKIKQKRLLRDMVIWISVSLALWVL